MPFQIKPITDQKTWEKFLNQHLPHTFLQTWEWSDFQTQEGSTVYRLGIYENDKLAGLAFVYKITARRGSFLFCPHGPLIDWSQTEAFNAFIDHLRQLATQEKVDFIRISPLVGPTSKTPTPEATQMFQKAGFRPAPIHMHPELAWLLDLTPTEEELLQNMKKRTRYSVRKAEKDGVKIETSYDPKDLDKFYQLYQETAVRQHFVPFSQKYIQREFEILSAADKIRMFFAHYHNEIVANAMIVFTNGSGFYHHGASNRKYPTIPAAELLQWEAIREAKRRGLKLYNFWGIAPEDDPKHPWVGLSRFKKGFGGFPEAYLHAQDLPLTPKYWLNYIVETIRRIRRRY